MNYLSKYKKTEVYSNLSIARQTILTRNEGHYSLILSDENGNTMLCLSKRNKRKNEKQVSPNQPITPEYCVELCRKVLGLKVNEIAKVIGISRATLDLHRKGANVKSKELVRYNQLHNFVNNIDTIYGDSLKNGMRNVLIHRKTLTQHIINHADNLDEIFKLIDDASDTLGAVKVDNKPVDPLKLQSRLAGIGKLA